MIGPSNQQQKVKAHWRCRCSWVLTHKSRLFLCFYHKCGSIYFSVHLFYRCKYLSLHWSNTGSALRNQKLTLQLMHTHIHILRLWCATFCSLQNLSLVIFTRINWSTLLTFMDSHWQKTRTNGELGPSNYFYFSYEQWGKALRKNFWQSIDFNSMTRQCS